MRALQCLFTAMAVAIVVSTFACADAAAPAKASTLDSLSSLSDHALLVAVLGKLNDFQARLDSEARIAEQRYDSITALLAEIAHDSGGEGEKVLSAEAEARVCGNLDLWGEGKLASHLSLWGGGEGMLGIDAYGNGAKGLIRGFATEDVEFEPVARGKVTGELCVKMIADLRTLTGLTPPARGGTRVAAAGTQSAAETMLQNMLHAVNPDQLASVASRLNIDGSRIGAAVDAVASLSRGDIRIGQGGALQLLSTLPLPPDIASVLRNPASLLQDAPQAVQYAIDNLCSGTLFTGSFAQRASEACNLRNQIPSGQGLVTILNGLNGLPVNLSTIQTRLGGTCTAINTMRTARVTIPSWDVTFPLGIGTLNVFPGYDKAVFPGLLPVC